VSTCAAATSGARLTTAYGAAARRHGTTRAGINTARVLRGSAAADAAGEETCNEPTTRRVVTVDNSNERLFVRATYSGTPAGYQAELADATNWPAEVGGGAVYIQVEHAVDPSRFLKGPPPGFNY
jgi:hypothetical protein